MQGLNQSACVVYSHEQTALGWSQKGTDFYKNNLNA